MNTGISADEACRNHVLSEEDFVRTCNPDGSLKGQASTTTVALKSDPSQSVTVNNSIVYASVLGLALIVALVAVLLVKRRGKKRSR